MLGLPSVGKSHHLHLYQTKIICNLSVSYQLQATFTEPRSRSIVNNKSSKVTFPGRVGRPLGGLSDTALLWLWKDASYLHALFPRVGWFYLSGYCKSLNTSQERKGIDSNEHVIRVKTKWVHDSGTTQAPPVRGDRQASPISPELRQVPEGGGGGKEREEGTWLYS